MTHRMHMNFHPTWGGILSLPIWRRKKTNKDSFHSSVPKNPVHVVETSWKSIPHDVPASSTCLNGKVITPYSSLYPCRDLVSSWLCDLQQLCWGKKVMNLLAHRNWTTQCVPFSHSETWLCPWGDTSYCSGHRLSANTISKRISVYYSP